MGVLAVHDKTREDMAQRTAGILHLMGVEDKDWKKIEWKNAPSTGIDIFKRVGIITLEGVAIEVELNSPILPELPTTQSQKDYNYVRISLQNDCGVDMSILSKTVFHTNNEKNGRIKSWYWHPPHMTLYSGRDKLGSNYYPNLPTNQYRVERPNGDRDLPSIIEYINIPFRRKAKDFFAAAKEIIDSAR